MTLGIRTFLEGMGQGFPGDEQEKTPERVARAWVEDLVSGYALDPAALLTWGRVPEGSGPVMVRDVSFSSICVHHLLPFFGRAHVAYLPRTRLAGLSKIGRVVDAHARRLQTQEHLSAGIVATLSETLEADGVIAVLEAEHTCMTLRGVRKEQSRMTTLATAGHYDRDSAARREILGLLGRPTSGDLTR